MHQCVYAGNTSHPTIFHVILEAEITTLQARQASWRPGRNSVFYSDFLQVDMVLAYCGEQSDLCKKSSSKNALKKKCPSLSLTKYLVTVRQTRWSINSATHFVFWGAFIDFIYSDDFEFVFQYHTPNLRGVKILPKLSEISQKVLYDFQGFSFTL